MKLFIILIFSIFSFSSMIRSGFFPMQDDLQAFRLLEMKSCVVDGQIPCRWTPLSGFGYGYPLFQYYAPFPFYLGQPFLFIGFQAIDTVKILFILSILLGSTSMFLLVRKLSNSNLALLSSVVYTFLPYHAQQVYVRGALNEAWAFGLYPLVTLLFINYLKRGNLRSLGMFSLSLGILLITHNLMSYFLIPILFIIAINSKGIKKLLLGLFISMMASSFFIFPLLTERSFAHLETLTGGYFGYQQHFVSLKQLFIDNRWEYGSSRLGVDDDLSLSVGIAALILTGFTFLYSTIKKKFSFLYISLLLLSIFYTFLIHEKSSFLWSIFSPLIWLQFPWRLLFPVGFILSLLVSQSKEFSPRLQKMFIVVGILLTLVLHGGFFMPKSWDYKANDIEKFSGDNLIVEQTRSVFDYLPKSASRPPNIVAPSEPEIIGTEGKIIFWNKRSSSQYGQIELSNPGTVRIPIYDFPGMVVEVNNSISNHFSNECTGQDYCFGLVSINLSEGVHNVEVRLEKTLIREVSDIISLVSLITVIVMICLG